MFHVEVSETFEKTIKTSVVELPSLIIMAISVKLLN